MVLQMAPATISGERRPNPVASWDERRSVVIALIGSAYYDATDLNQLGLTGREVLFEQWPQSWSADAEDWIGDLVERVPRGAWLLLAGSRRDVCRARLAALDSGFAPVDIVEQLIA